MSSQCISGQFLGSRNWGAVESLMDGRKSIVFAQSCWILREKSDGSEGSNWGICSDAWVTTQDWYSHCTSLTAGLWEIVTHIGDLIMPLGVHPLPNLYGFSLWSIGQMPVVQMGIFPISDPVFLPNGQASSGSEAQGSLGTCRVICSSSLGSGVGEAEAGAGGGAMGSFSATYKISRFRRLSPSRMGPKPWQSSCTTPHSTPSGIPNWTTQLWRATARAIISPFLTSQ